MAELWEQVEALGGYPEVIAAAKAYKEAKQAYDAAIDPHQLEREQLEELARVEKIKSALREAWNKAHTALLEVTLKANL